MSFYICHCGNTEDRHYFRHPFERVASVTREQTAEEGEWYGLNALDFPEKSKVKCAISECTAGGALHETEVVRHAYNPRSYLYRDVRLSLPKDAVCNHKKCKVVLQDHRAVQTHRFMTRVVVANRQELDVVEVSYPEDEDIKISS